MSAPTKRDGELRASSWNCNRLNSTVILIRLLAWIAMSPILSQPCQSEVAIKYQAHSINSNSNLNSPQPRTNNYNQKLKQSSTLSDILLSQSPYSAEPSAYLAIPKSGLLSTSRFIAPQRSRQHPAVMMNQQQLPSNPMSMATNGEDYKCALYCTCSMIQVVDKETGENMANLTQAKCENSKFSDILTIDRRTQIIHISLPPQPDPTKPLEAKPMEPIAQPFRMPRLNQYNLLRELVIVSLKFQVCDSEVFKRGQKLRRLRLNHNQLIRISKACFKYLDRLIELNLDHNQLGELESALFGSLLSLKVLSIAHNQLTDLAAHQFANLTQLVSLNLVGNLFKIINLHLFEPMQNSLRLLVLAKNQIKSFVHQAPLTTTSIQIQPVISIYSNSTMSQQESAKSMNMIKAPILQPTTTISKVQSQFAGVVFKNLVKLNVDSNQIERIKLLQLHRFFNVKFISIRQNNIASIRDKAFNGLKLVELNLAHNRLQSISKCAFCNATIKRLVLANNNISIALPNVLLDSAGVVAPTILSQSAPSSPTAAALLAGSLAGNNNDAGPEAVPVAMAQSSSMLQQQQPNSMDQQQQSSLQVSTSSSSQNVLILSQSILGPLFSQLEYLDLSNNEQLASHLDLLVEPLLKLKYLNIANCGLDRSLPNPSLFKNLHQLKYLNLSHNQLDQLIAETVEPLGNLEILDMSHNKFNELDESFLVTLDDMSSLKVINLASNPWFCSQCKVAPLYDWVLRSPVYNNTCLASGLLNGGDSTRTRGHNLDTDESTDDTSLDEPAYPNEPVNIPTTEDESNDENARAGSLPASRSGVNYRTQLMPQIANNVNMNQQREDYSILIDGDSSNRLAIPTTISGADIDFESILASSDIDGQSNNSINSAGAATNYQLDQLDGSSSSSISPNLQRRIKAFATLISSIDGLATSEDDLSIINTMATTLADGLAVSHTDYCLRCEFPGELRAFQLHELSPGDFKYCAGSAPRFQASEPKIGLTLAIVVIGALFCIIIVVIIMYRRKSHTYYTNGDETDQLESGTNPGGKKQPVFSISSDGEHQYGDATDYSSPPMSQSYESSFSNSQSAGDEDEELDEAEEYTNDDEDEEEDDEELEDIDEDENENNTEPDGLGQGEDHLQLGGLHHAIEHSENNRSTGEDESQLTTEVKEAGSPSDLSRSRSSQSLNRSHSERLAQTTNDQSSALSQVPQQHSSQNSAQQTEVSAPNIEGKKIRRDDSAGSNNRSTQAHSLSRAASRQSPPTRTHKVRLKSKTSSGGGSAAQQASVTSQNGDESELNVSRTTNNDNGGRKSATSEQKRRSAMKAAKTIEQSTPTVAKLRRPTAIVSARSESTGGNETKVLKRQQVATPEIELRTKAARDSNQPSTSATSQPPRASGSGSGSKTLGPQRFKGTSSGVSGMLIKSGGGSRSATLSRSRRGVSPGGLANVETQVSVDPEVLLQPSGLDTKQPIRAEIASLAREPEIPVLQAASPVRNWNVMSPSASAEDDATSADSLAMEALNYLVASDDLDDDDVVDHNIGAALEPVSPSEFGLNDEALDEAPQSAHRSLHKQPNTATRLEANSSGGFKFRTSNSTHSALTQTVHQAFNMRVFVSAVAILSLAVVASAAVDEQILNLLEGVKNTLTALEDRASVGESDALFRPELDTTDIGKTYEYFKTNTRYRLSSIRRKYPLLYSCATAVLNTYEGGNVARLAKMFNNGAAPPKHNYLRTLTNEYIRIREAEFADKKVDNFELIAGTPTYNFVKTVTCGKFPLSQALVDEVIKEFYTHSWCNFENANGSEFPMLDSIERRAVYFGNTPVAVIRQYVGFLPEEKQPSLEEVKRNLLDGLNRVGYNSKC